MKTYVLSLIAGAALVAGCNQSVKSASESFNELPPSVQKTVRAEAPNAEILGVTHHAQDGTSSYTVSIRENGRDAKMVVAADGHLLSSELPDKSGPLNRALTPTGAAGTPFSALPLAAQKTIRSHAPAEQISQISRQEDNGRVIYKVEFAEPGTNPTLRVAEDGTLVQTLQK